MPPVTIDKLGNEVSIRYAENSKADQKLLKEAQDIRGQTEIDITHPSFIAELEMLFPIQKQQTWATFIPPVGYFEQKKRFFGFQLISSLGSEEKHEKQVQKIISQSKTLPRKKRNNQQGDQDNQQGEPDNNPEKEYHEKEKKTLVSVLQTIMYLDKEIQEINARRGQYHKG